MNKIILYWLMVIFVVISITIAVLATIFRWWMEPLEDIPTETKPVPGSSS